MIKSKADIKGSDYYVEIKVVYRYGEAYAHIERYTHYAATIMPKEGTRRPGEWEIPELTAFTLTEAKEDFQGLAELFGFTDLLEWEDQD